MRKSIFPDAESTALIDTGMDDTRVNIPEAIIRSDPSTNSFADEIALWFGPGNVVANIPFRIGTCATVADVYHLFPTSTAISLA